MDPYPDYAGVHEKPYGEYELEPHQKDSLKQIRKCLKDGYADQVTLRSHLNYLEDLCTRVREILRAEEGAGYNNVTLKHDFKKAQELQQLLSTELDRMD